MKKQSPSAALLLALGVSLVGSPLAGAAEIPNTLFSLQEVSKPILIACDKEHKCGKDGEHRCGKDGEHKCGKDGEHKCGAGSCGSKSGEGDKGGEHKCGAGSCGSKPGEGDKGGEHKCGAGSCGSKSH